MQTTLYDLRKNHFDLTQEEMANIIGTATKTYGEKERGLVPFNQDEMFKISSYFNLPIDQIFLPRKHRNGNKDISNKQLT